MLGFGFGFGFGLPRRYHGITATPPTQSSSTKKAASHLADGDMRGACRRAYNMLALMRSWCDSLRVLVEFCRGPCEVAVLSRLVSHPRLKEALINSKTLDFKGPCENSKTPSFEGP